MQTQDLIAKLERAADALKSTDWPECEATLRQAITHITTQDALLGECDRALGDALAYMENRPISIPEPYPAAACRDVRARITAHLRPVDPVDELAQEVANALGITGASSMHTVHADQFRRVLATELRKRGIGKEVG